MDPNWYTDYIDGLGIDSGFFMEKFMSKGLHTETPDASGGEANSEPSTVIEEEAGELSDRDKIYEKYEEEEEPLLQPENKEKESDEPAGEEEEGKAPEKKAKTEPSTVIEESVPSDESEEIKKDKTNESTVPYGALHEEREKRKKAERELKDLQSQREEIALKKQEEEDVAPIEDYDLELTTQKSKMRNLEDEVNRLKSRDSEREEIIAEGRRRDEQTRVDKVVTDTSKSLEGEGYPGFKDYQQIISGEILKKAQDEPNLELRNEYLSGVVLHPDDNPEGWKKIYKETVYPKYSKLHLAQDKKVLMGKKVALKKEASLISTPGGNDLNPPKKETETGSFDEHMEERMQNIKRGLPGGAGKS